MTSQTTSTSASQCPKLIITLIGVPAAGKGTQGILLSQKYHLPHLAIGEMIQEEIVQATALGALIHHHLTTSQERLPDAIATGLLTQRLSREDCQKGFILDGFPRTVGQTVVLMNTIAKVDDLHIPIFLDIPEALTHERVKKRFLCSSCGKVIRSFDKMVRAGFCPFCDQRLIQRQEDVSSEKLSQRFRKFHEISDEIFPLIQIKSPIRCVKIGERDSPQTVFERVDAIIQKSLEERCTEHF